MYKGIITLTNENRLSERFAIVAYDKGMWQSDGYYPIIDNKTKKKIGVFVCAYGDDLMVKFLSWWTNYRRKNTTKHYINY